MAYEGDFVLGSTFDVKFTSVNGSGAPTALTSSPVVQAYGDNSTTEVTPGGITLTTSFDGRPALNNVRVVATSGNGYAAGSNYALVITAGAIGQLNPNGYVVGSFSIEARSNLTAAQVNAEVVDALNVDTYAEPGQEAPPATTTLVKKLSYLYKFLRNKKTQDATTLSVFADDTTTVDQKATISDSGTVYTHGEIASGP